MDLGLKNRVAIVAASSQGIGRATAESFAAEGCVVAMCARSKDSLTTAADAIRDRSTTEVFAASLDVGDATAVHQFVEEVAKKYGRIDICVTNAGGPPAKGFLATSAADWDGAVRLTFSVWSISLRRSFPICNAKSGAHCDDHLDHDQAAGCRSRSIQRSARCCYGASSESRQRIRKDGILVNNVGPGFTATDRLKELATARSSGSGKTQQEIFDGWAADAPLRRLGQPNEVADASFGSRPIVLRTSQGKHFLLMVVSTRVYRVSNLESFLQQLLRRPCVFSKLSRISSNHMLRGSRRRSALNQEALHVG